MWDVITTDKFDEWYNCLGDADKVNVLAGIILLKDKGPSLPKPYAYTAKGSKYPNMQELRVQSKGKPLRAFFTIDPIRKAVQIFAGNSLVVISLSSRLLVSSKANTKVHLFF